jgi:hypothetical protein
MDRRTATFAAASVFAGTTLLPRKLAAFQPGSPSPSQTDLCVDTMADLRTVAVGAVSCLTLIGYDARGDGGGGNFYWDASSTETDDKGTIITPSTNPPMGRWKRLVGGPISVKWFGARAGNIAFAAQNTTAIQSAIDSLPSTGGLVYVPGNDDPYYFQGPINLRPGVTLRGDGRAATILSNTANADGIYAPPSPTPLGVGGLQVCDYLTRVGANPLSHCHQTTRNAGSGIHLDGGQSGIYFSLEEVAVIGHIDGVSIRSSIAS